VNSGAEPVGTRSGRGLAIAALLVAPFLVVWNGARLLWLLYYGEPGFMARACSGPQTWWQSLPGWIPAYSTEYWQSLGGALVGIIGGLVCAALLGHRSTRDGVETRAEGPPPNGAQARDLDDRGLFFYCAVFDRSPVAHVLLDGSGRIIRLNHAAEQLTGHLTANVRRQLYWEVFLDAAEAESAAWRFHTPESTVPVQETWVTSGGESRRILWSRVPFHDQEGRLTNVLLAVAPPRDSVASALSTDDLRDYGAEEAEYFLDLMARAEESAAAESLGPGTSGKPEGDSSAGGQLREKEKEGRRKPLYRR
jgi:PAS domain S-box-containing protein